VHESFPTFSTDYSALAVATDTPTHPTCGVDPNTGMSACGEAYILIAGSGIVVVSGSIEVAPKEATNPVGTDHTVTAHVTSGGSPLAGQTVTFTVTGQNAGAIGTCVPAGCVTDASGNVSFTYHDGNGAGDDTIKASFTDATGSLQSATAQKHWVVVEQPITATGTTVSATEGASFSGTVATFTDPDTKATASEYSATIEWGDSTTTTGTISGPTGGPFSVGGSHTYAEEGSYTITVKITDVDESANSATATSTAKVADAALSSMCAAPAVSPQAFAGPTATFTDADPGGMQPPDYKATIDWGDSTSSAGTIPPGSGPGPYTVNGTHTYTSEGPHTITTTIKDEGGSKTVATCTTLVFGLAPGGGAFVIGDENATIGKVVTFSDVEWWGSNWWKENSLSGGPAPAAFKGFAESSPNPPTCGESWKTDTGNSSGPPPTVPEYMAVIAASKITQSGSIISGNAPEVVVVKTNPGYLPNPGHKGTGKLIAIVCKS
jgi:hypothetical protein